MCPICKSKMHVKVIQTPDDAEMNLLECDGPAKHTVPIIQSTPFDCKTSRAKFNQLMREAA